MDDDKVKKPVLNIDAQKDFNPVAAADDGLSAAKIKDYLKNIDLKKIMEELPLKKMQHGQSEENIWLNNKPSPLLMDKSGSMGDIFMHELPHGDSYKIYKKELLENTYDIQDFGKKIIIFDEITNAGKEGVMEKFRDYFNDMTAALDSYRASQACGQALAETCHAGVAQPVAVRKPLSFRPRA